MLHTDPSCHLARLGLGHFLPDLIIPLSQYEKCDVECATKTSL